MYVSRLALKGNLRSNGSTEGELNAKVCLRAQPGTRPRSSKVINARLLLKQNMQPTASRRPGFVIKVPRSAPNSFSYIVELPWQRSTTEAKVFRERDSAEGALRWLLNHMGYVAPEVLPEGAHARLQQSSVASLDSLGDEEISRLSLVYEPAPQGLRAPGDPGIISREERAKSLERHTQGLQTSRSRSPRRELPHGSLRRHLGAQ